MKSSHAFSTSLTESSLGLRHTSQRRYGETLNGLPRHPTFNGEPLFTRANREFQHLFRFDRLFSIDANTTRFSASRWKAYFARAYVAFFCSFADTANQSTAATRSLAHW